jgi:hypothetical protein
MGETSTSDGARAVRDIQGLIGELTDDEAALVRTLTPGELTTPEAVEHLFDLVDLITTMRYDEALADYVFAIAPDWDGSIGLLLLGGRVTTALARYELERRVPEHIG